MAKKKLFTTPNDSKPEAKPGSGQPELGERIKKIRKHFKLSQTDFAEPLGSSATALSEIENNKYKPGFDILMNLVDKFSVNVHYILTGDGPVFIEGNAEAASSSIEKIDENLTEDERMFLRYFRLSPMFKYEMLIYFRKIMLTGKDMYDQEIEKELSRDTD